MRYAGRKTGAFLARSEALLGRLDRALAPGAALPIGGALETFRSPLAPTLLARPRGSRAPIVGDALVLPTDDPVWALRRQLERAYQARLVVDPTQVVRFLERRVPPMGESLAANLRLDTLDDFLSFEALRRAVPMIVSGAPPSDTLSQRLAKHFTFTVAPEDGVDNDWVRCAGFRVRRLSDHVTLEDARAS